LYALLTGRPPFEAETQYKLLAKIHSEEPVPPRKFQPAIPALVEAVVLKMLEKRPDERYQTAAALVAELDRVGKVLEE
jgi:serine/threonine-protein kinase